MASNINGRYNSPMTKKAKFIVLLVFILLLLAVYFLLWKNKAFAPHTILVQNYADAVIPEPEVSQNNSKDKNDLEALKKTIEPEINNNFSKKLPASPASEPTKKADLKINQKLVSWGFSSASNRKIDTIIIHSSYNALGGDVYDIDKLIQEYKDYGVAPHYLIDRQGKIYQLVAEKNIAYHAGESKIPDGRTQVNNFSLGIEMMNTKEDNYTGEQYVSLKSLLAKIKSNYSIKYVLGHNDISPGRKTDPWNFEWKKIN